MSIQVTSSRDSFPRILGILLQRCSISTWPISFAIDSALLISSLVLLKVGLILRQLKLDGFYYQIDMHFIPFCHPTHIHRSHS